MSTIAHFSLAQYDSMIGSGVFGSRGRHRMEFIRGRGSRNDAPRTET